MVVLNIPRPTREQMEAGLRDCYRGLRTRIQKGEKELRELIDAARAKQTELRELMKQARDVVKQMEGL